MASVSSSQAAHVVPPQTLKPHLKRTFSELETKTSHAASPALSLLESLASMKDLEIETFKAGADWNLDKSPSLKSNMKTLESLSSSNPLKLLTHNPANKLAALMAVSKMGMLLDLVSEEFKKDPDVVLAAVKQDGWALSCAHDDMKNIRQIVKSAIFQNGLSLAFASSALRGDLKLAALAVFQNPYALQFVSDELKDDDSLVERALLTFGTQEEWAARSVQAFTKAPNYDFFRLRHATDGMKPFETLRETLKQSILKADSSPLEYASARIQALAKFKELAATQIQKEGLDLHLDAPSPSKATSHKAKKSRMDELDLGASLHTSESVASSLARSFFSASTRSVSFRETSPISPLLSLSDVKPGLLGAFSLTMRPLPQKAEVSSLKITPPVFTQHNARMIMTSNPASMKGASGQEDKAESGK